MPPGVIALCILIGRENGLFVALLIMIPAMVICSAPMAEVLRHRYRGRSLIVLMIGYFLVEFFLCAITELGAAFALAKWMD